MAPKPNTRCTWDGTRLAIESLSYHTPGRRHFGLERLLGKLKRGGYRIERTGHPAKAYAYPVALKPGWEHPNTYFAVGEAEDGIQ